MSTLQAPSPHEPATLRTESEAILAAIIAGVIGAVLGLLFGLFPLPATLSGTWAFGTIAGLVAGVAAAVSSALGYWRARSTDVHDWRRDLASWRYIVSTISVVLAHVALTVIATVAIFEVFDRAFIGVVLSAFWTTVLLSLATGLAAYCSYLSASRMTTQRLTWILISFISIGTLAAMVTTSDPEWWKYHFSQLGTFNDLSSFLFNGTLIAAGLLVTTFTLYVGNDLRQLQERGVIDGGGIRVVTTALAIMGIMLALVGVFPVDVNMTMHNLSASGMALMFLLLLIAGPWLLRGMPRAYFLSAWGFLAALVVSIVLFVVTYFGLTAFEIIVFALIFGWLSVFIRFLGVTGQSDPLR